MHLVEAEFGINEISVPAGGAVRVHRNRVVAEGGKIGGHRRRLFFHILLIRNASIRKERHRSAGQVFKFCVGSVAALDGDI